jgi:branched-chain amino acid transport system ATP-binding protein
LRRCTCIRELKRRGFTILHVEQNFRFAATVADRFCVMANGRIVETIERADLDGAMDRLHQYLGV